VQQTRRLDPRRVVINALDRRLAQNILDPPERVLQIHRRSQVYADGADFDFRRDRPHHESVVAESGGVAGEQYDFLETTASEPRGNMDAYSGARAEDYEGSVAGGWHGGVVRVWLGLEGKIVVLVSGRRVGLL
jgi:hypothetical protein